MIIEKTQLKPFGIQLEDIEQLPAVSELTALCDEHKLVLIRGAQQKSRQELLQYCQAAGELLQWDFGPVMEMKVDSNKQNYLFTEDRVPLHWDGAFHREPRFLVFHCIQAPLNNCGGETLFINGEKLLRLLSPEKITRMKQVTINYKTEKVVHYGGHINRHLIEKHPISGRPILRFAEPVGADFLNPVEVWIDGEDSNLIDELTQLCEHEEIHYSHQWQTGDYLIADNFSLLHGRNAFTKHSPRHLRRIQIL